MNETIISAAGYIIALFASGFGLYLWRRAIAMQNEVHALSTKLAESSQESSQLKGKREHWQEQLRSKEKELLQKAREILDLDKVRTDFVRESSDQQKTLHEKQRVLEKELDHYKTQADTLLQQLREIDREHSALKNTRDKEGKEKIFELERTIASMKDENKRLHTQSSNLDQNVKGLQSRLAELQDNQGENSELVKRLRRKVHQYDHLYKTIRGQKEMLEERLGNWERALRLLAVWALNEKGVDTSGRSAESLGEIVAAALQATEQGQLLSEEELEEEGLASA